MDYKTCTLILLNSSVSTWHHESFYTDSGYGRLTFTASWRTWLIVFGPLSTWALRGDQLLSRSSTVFCSRKRILAGSSLFVVKDRMRPKYWSIKDWNENRFVSKWNKGGLRQDYYSAVYLMLTLAFSWSSLGPTVLIIWQRHSKSSPISLSWTFFFLSKSLKRKETQSKSTSTSSTSSDLT